MIKIEGVETTLKAMRGKAKADAENIAKALEACARILYRKSQTLVPVDTGDLKQSGRVEVSGRGFGATAKVVYANEYAVPVHEILEAYHEPPTQARYLADAVVKVRGAMVARLKRQMTAGTKLV